MAAESLHMTLAAD